MSMSAALAGQINIETGGGACAKPLSAAEERRQRLLETADEIPCPGGCGGMAWLEHAVTTATRDGETRHFRMATCAGECKVPVPEARGNYAKTRPGRFEVAADAPESRPDHPLPEPEQTATMAARNAVQAAIQARNVNIYMLASDLRLDYTKLRRWLDKGRGLSPVATSRVIAWAATPATQPKSEEATVAAAKKVNLDEKEREIVSAALKKANWPAVELATHIGSSRSGMYLWLKEGNGLAQSYVLAALEWAAAVGRGEVERNTLTRQQKSAATRMKRSGKSPQEPAQASEPDAAPPEPPKPRHATLSVSKEDTGYISPERMDQAIADWVGPPAEEKPEPSSSWEAAFSPLLEQGAMDRLAELVGPEAARAFRVRVILEARS